MSLHGATIERSAGAVEMSDPAKVWIVEQGSVDLFAVEVDEQGDGSPHHLLRLPSGGAIFGMDCAGTPYTTRGRLAPETELRLVDRAKFLASCQSDESVGKAIQTWICVASECIVDQIPPRAAKRLQNGQGLSAGESSLPVYTNENVAWLRLVTGSIALHGQHVPDLKQGSYFPTTRAAWVELAPDSEIAVEDMGEMSADAIAAAIDSFHGALARAIESSIRRSEFRYAERLERRTEADVRRYANSLSRMGSALVADHLEDRVDASGSKLFLAASRVAAASGIELTAPTERIDDQNGVEALARAASVRVRKVLLRGDWWNTDAGPLLAFQDPSGSPVALLPKPGGGYRLFDPEKGLSDELHFQVRSSLGPTAYTFFRPFPAKAITGLDLMLLAGRECRPELAVVGLVGLAASALGILVPFATGVIYDSTIPSADRSDLVRLSLFLVGSAFASGLFMLTRSFALLRLETKMDAYTQAAVWDRLLSLPVTFFRDYTAGDLAQRSMGISQIRQMLTNTAVSSILSGVFSISNFLLLFYYNVPMALAATGLISTAVVLSIILGVVRVRLERELAQVRGKLSGLLLQFLTGIAKLRVSGTEDRAFALWADRFGWQRQLSLRMRRHSRIQASVISVYPVISLMFLFYCGTRMGEGSAATMTAGQFLAFMTAFSLFLSSALQLSSAVISVLSILPAYERAAPILQTLPEVTPGKSHPGVLSGRIEVNQVTFGYDETAPPILNELSLTAEAGQFIALVGGSGSGKSTLLRLLLGFESPASGAIFYDGQNMAQLDIQAVRQQTGVVLQNGSVFRGDIFTNIVGSSLRTVEDAWEAARLSAFDKDIESMPMGMHTVITEDGGLSGGQRQRLMIARAIVNRPRILFFDEATSALDNATQETVSRSLEQLQATRVVVAHRLSTIVKADCIFVLEKGKVVQKGTYEELVSQPGPFLDLAKRQMI